MKQLEFYLATKNITAYVGDGNYNVIEIKKGDVFTRGEDSYFDQYTMEFNFYKDNRLIELPRKSGFLSLPEGFVKITL